MQSAIDEALDEIDDDSEYRSAFDLAFKKYNTMSRLEPDVQVRRIQSLLQRKGFGFGTISQVLKELDLLKSQAFFLYPAGHLRLLPVTNFFA